jgi:hypothetical protein
MKRLVLSVVGGVAIPVVYTAIVIPLTIYIDNDTWGHYLSYPVRWPVILYYQFVSFDVPGDGLTILFIACNVLLYTLVTYVLLLTFSKPKATSRLPPPPAQNL